MRKSCVSTSIVLLLGIVIYPSAVAEAYFTITRSELNGDQMRLEGEDAQPNAPITVDGEVLGTADASGRFDIQVSGYDPPADCVVTVSDGSCTLDSTLDGCTPDEGGGDPPGGGGGDPCASFPPVPQAGQQITWSAADSPFHVCADLTIPASATVVVEPGVTINIDPLVTLIVQGTLLGQGTQLAPITVNGGKVIVFGAMELDWTTINSRIEPRDGGGAMMFRDCTFLADQQAMLTEIGQPTYVWDNPPLVYLERCTFTGDGSGYEFYLDICHVVLKDVTFTGTGVGIWDAYVYIDNVTIDGGLLDLFFANVDAHQDVYINNVTARNNAVGPGISLFGVNGLLGPNNVLENNLYPASAMGLLPGSVVPPTGNIQNLVHAAGLGPGAIWSNVAVPWYYDGTSGCTVAFPSIEPGTTVKMGPAASICNQGGTIQLRGLPDAPIVFEPLNPAQPWSEIIVHVSYGSRIDNCVFDGASNIGLLVTNAGAQVKNCVFQNCNVATNCNTFASSFFENTRFIANAVGASFSDLGHPHMNSPTNPNSFEGNTLALDAFDFGSDTDAGNCWWNHPTGPQAPGNPGGQGDAIGGISAANVNYQPFLTAPPDFNNDPPVVRLEHTQVRPAYALYSRFEPGSKLIVEWDAFDDDAIVEQQLLFSPAGDFPDDFTLVATLPPGQRSYEWTVPDVGFIVNGALSYLRVAATDTAGQIGWDDIRILIPSGRISGTGTVTSDFGGQTFRSGSALPTITWTFVADDPLFGGSPTFYILLDGDEKSVYLGGGGSGSWSLTDSAFVSTDTARIGVHMGGTTTDSVWFFGDYFSLRPDALIGDEPPSVTLLTPAAGSSFAGGGTVPMSWTASDDEGLRSFNIQASFDGGRLWRTIARDLPGTATSFNWQLPASDGIADVRVRVVAKDLRFQNSSDGGNTVFNITPGSGAIPGDIDGDGAVDMNDVSMFVNVLIGIDTDPSHMSASDLNGDGAANGADAATMIDLLMN